MTGHILEFSQHLKDWYIQTRYHAPDDGTEDMWQLLYPEHFVNVQLKRYRKKRKENEIASVASMMREGLVKHIDSSSSQVHVFEKLPQLHGDSCTESIISEISGIFSPVQHEDGTSVEPKMILINGAPGIGKTTLCKEIAFRWANRSLLMNNSLVFLLFLRDPGVKKIYELKDLIHFFYDFDPSADDLSKQLAKILIKRGNGDITILLDGFDEFSNTDKNLLVNKIISRKFLAQGKLVITSRPISSEKLQKVSDITVEVLGFTEESRMSFIKKELDGCQNEISRLTSILNICGDINSFCYFPIMMTILVCIFKYHDELPNDEAELYEKFVILTVSRFSKKLKINPPITDKRLKNLPQAYKDYLGKLSKLAFEFIKVNQVVFTKEDVESICNNFNLDFDNYHGLGLLNYTGYTKIIGFNKCVYYNFLHLAIQEFLAAYHIDSLDISDQFQLLKSTYFIDSYIQVWIMFIQMNKSNVRTFHQFKTYIHTLGSSNEIEHNAMSMINSLNLFEDLSKINTSKIAGTFHVLCFKDTEHGLCKQEACISSYDAFCFLEDVYYHHGILKIYLSLCSVDDNVDQLMEFFLLDMNIGETVYHHMVAELGRNKNIAVVLVSSSTLLAYRAKSHQICHALMMNDSLSAIMMRDCHITDEVADILSLYLKNHPTTKHVSLTNWNRNNNKALLQPLSCIMEALKSRNDLITIDLGSNHLSEKVLCDLADAIENNINLQEVSLNDNNLRSSANTILHVLIKLSKLKNLNLSSNYLTSEEGGHLLANVIQNNTDLEILNLSFNNIHLSAKAILEALSKVANLRALSLSNTNLSNRVIDDLANAVKSNTLLTVLRLSNNNLQSSAIRLLQALKELSHLVQLDLDNSNMSYQVVDGMAEVIRNNTHLEVLCLSNNNLQSSVTVVLCALKGISKLKTLKLSCNNISGKVAEDLADVIINNTGLEELYIDDNHLQSSAVTILQALKQISTLRVLHLGCNNMPEIVAVDLADVIRNNSHLEVLFFNNNRLQSSITVVLQALKDISNLKKINLRNNNISGTNLHDFKDVFLSNTCLEEVYLGNNDLRLSEIVILQSLKGLSSLRALDLDNSNISEKAVDHLATVIKHNTLLEKLYLEDNNLQSSVIVVLQALKEISNLTLLNINGLSGIAVNNLADVINANVFLKELHLSSNKLQSSAALVFKSLKQNSNLKILDFGDSKVSGNAMEDLANVIKNSTCLEVLNLSNNNLQSSVGVIFQALKEISTIKKLNLFGNNMPKQVDQDLADVVTNNTSLEAIILGSNNLQASVVVKVLMQLSSLKVLDLGNNNLSRKALQDLPGVINNNIQLEVLILNNNNLQPSIILILQALKGISNLQKLHLYCTNIPGIAVNELADVIKANPCLEDLDLSYNKNLQSCMVVILQALIKTSNLKILSLSGNNIPEAVVNSLAGVIKNIPYLEILSLDHNTLKSSAKVILHALKVTSNLRKLNLNSNKMPEEVACDLADVVKHNTYLEEIQLLNNNLQSSSVILNALQTVYNLKVISLDAKDMSTKETSCLADIIRCNPYLEKLELLSLQSSILVILQALERITTLKVLTLLNCYLSAEMKDELTGVMNNNTSLEEICLCYCSEPSALVMIQALKRVSGLKKLSLQGNNMSGKVVTDLADVIKSNTSLEEIYLDYNNLQSSVVVILVALKSISTLKKISLQNNGMSGEVVNDLADVIRNNSSLEVLNLVNNQLQSSIVVVLHALQSTACLKMLILESIHMSGKAVEDLASVITINTSLCVLCLGFSGLKSSAGIVLQAMKKLTQLRILTLSNSVSRNLVNDLADVIRNNTYLEVLSLSSNSLQSSADVVLQAVEGLTNLKILDIGNNRMSGKALRRLSRVFRNNSLLWLEIGGNDLSPGLTIASHAGSQLQSLVINDSNLTVAAVSGLLATLHHNHTILDLWLGDNNLQNGLLNITEHCSMLPNVESLELSHNTCSISDVANLASHISNIASLKVLIFGGIILNSKEYFYIRFFTVFGQLQYSTVEDIYSMSELVEVVTLEMQKYLLGSYIKYICTCKLRLFSFTQSTLYCHVNTYKIVYAIEQWFKCTTATALSAAKSSLQNLLRVESEVIVSTLSNSIKTLVVLDLEYSNIGGDAATKLAEGIQCNNVLEQLWLRGNVLCDRGAGLILNSLQSVTTLKVLDLSFNNISSTSSDDIVAVIKSNCLLEQLWLDGNYLQTAGIVRIADALQNHYKLRLLSLSKNGITEDAGEALYAIVCSNVSIEVLILGRNHLQSPGICELSKACYYLVRLIKLDLFDNQITKDCANGLADIIKSCTNLKELFLDDNMLETTGALTVLEAVNTICTLRIFTLSNNRITKEAASSICDVINKHFDLNVLLLGGNELQSDGVRMIAEVVKSNEALQLLAVCDNSVDEQTKDDIKVALSSNLDLHLYI